MIGNVYDHGKIYISKYKTIFFQMANNAILLNDGPLLDLMGIKKVNVELEEQTKWFGFVTVEKQLKVIGFMCGEQKVNWYYRDNCFDDLIGDTHTVTFVVAKESTSGENITLPGQLSRSRYLKTIFTSIHDYDNVCKLRTLHGNSNAMCVRSQTSKEFLFFDEAMRLLDKIMDNEPGRLRDLFRLLTRNSYNGRIIWEDLLGFFPKNWEPSYYHAIERIVQLMRQAIDNDWIGHGELQTLVVLSHDVVRDKESLANGYDHENQNVKRHQIEVWKSAAARLDTVLRSVYPAIDELALGPMNHEIMLDIYT